MATEFTPICLNAAVPEIAKLNQALKDIRTNTVAKLKDLTDQCEAVDKAGKQEHERIWSEVYDWARKNGHIPENSKNEDVALKFRDGVLFWRHATSEDKGESSKDQISKIISKIVDAIK